ncbi:MAG TPA: crotonase/enoyl-CoA hydratase family protein [Porticoccaceae bacterium]|nr:crotonase/enoyl-CoA hydratase family protein [Porticoccaceae bacterium]HIK79974.1 crotonase/enoyl-CoA hydratase family protein [Porticoccaceae bacterium]
MKKYNLPTLRAFTVTIHDSHVAEICLNRPEAINSMNNDFWRELPAIVNKLDMDGTIRVIILSSTGKHFTAGMDLEIFDSMDDDKDLEPARSAEKKRRWILTLQDAFTALERARMPVISAVQGACIGGGVDMVCATDMRFCTSNAFFNIKETELGITADVGTLQRIENVMPSGLARELAYTSRDLDATEAKRCGFINKVFDSQDEMLTEVRKLAATIAKHSPMAVNGVKEMLNYSREHTVTESLNYMATWQAGMFQAPDVKEALSAAKEKRTANYDGLRPL